MAKPDPGPEGTDSSPAQHRPPDQTQHHPVVLEQQAKRAHDTLTTELHNRLLGQPGR